MTFNNQRQLDQQCSSSSLAGGVNRGGVPVPSNSTNNTFFNNNNTNNNSNRRGGTNHQHHNNRGRGIGARRHRNQQLSLCEQSTSANYRPQQQQQHHNRWQNTADHRFAGPPHEHPIGRPQSWGPQNRKHRHYPTNPHQQQQQYQFNVDSQQQQQQQQQRPFCRDDTYIPGFVWDPVKRRHFRRVPDQFAVSSALSQYRTMGSSADKSAATTTQLAKQQPHVATILRQREMGGNGRTRVARLIQERCVSTCPPQPTATFEALPNHPDEPLQGCQFLECSHDGKNLIGSWKLHTPWARAACARIMCLAAETNMQDEDVCGLKFTPTENYIYAFDPSVVDFCQAPVDSCVTCVLYVTDPPLPECGSRVFLQPVPELSSEENTDNYHSPIYNIHWTLKQGVTSCAWNSAQMRVALGLDTGSLIVDVVSERDFKLSTRHKRVLAQEFTKDGNLLFIGLRGSDTQCCDLRLPAHHIVSNLAQTSTEWMHITPNNDQHLIASDLHGNMLLWDLRARRVLHQYQGHRNSAWKLPHAIDPEGQLLFAAGEDGVVRGWSLYSGRLLCAIPPSQQVNNLCDVPRICYSSQWAGVIGKRALLTTNENKLCLYEMDLH